MDSTYKPYVIGMVDLYGYPLVILQVLMTLQHSNQQHYISKSTPYLIRRNMFLQIKPMHWKGRSLHQESVQMQHSIFNSGPRVKIEYAFGVTVAYTT